MCPLWGPMSWPVKRHARGGSTSVDLHTFRTARGPLTSVLRPFRPPRPPFRRGKAARQAQPARRAPDEAGGATCAAGRTYTLPSRFVKTRYTCSLFRIFIVSRRPPPYDLLRGPVVHPLPPLHPSTCHPRRVFRRLIGTKKRCASSSEPTFGSVLRTWGGVLTDRDGGGVYSRC